MKKHDARLTAIKTVRIKLATVKVDDVAAELKCTRQNIYYHLDESKYQSASIKHIKEISEAIDKVKEKKEKDEAKQLSEIK